MATHRRGGAPTHNRSNSAQINQRAQLVNAYQELGKELGSEKLKVVGGYTLGRVIGEGSFGAVYLATHRLTGTRCAVKKIPKNMTGQLTREIHHHRSLHHRHILQLYEIIATETHVWLVTELCTGGELFDYLVERGRLLEGEARRFFGELTVAVGLLHRRGTVHRDLKLENVFLNGFCGVKLGDLGFAREWTRGSKLLETFCGTTGYAAPEMLQGQKYAGEEVDIWSLGIILYTLLCGGLPFDDDDEEVMKANVVRGEYEEPDWLSSDAKDLIKNMLQLEPSKRISIEDILSHAWFRKRIVDLPIDSHMSGQTNGSVTPFLNSPEPNNMKSYFSVAEPGQSSAATFSFPGRTETLAPKRAALSPLSSPRSQSPVGWTNAHKGQTSRLAGEPLAMSTTDSEAGTSDASFNMMSSSEGGTTSVTTPVLTEVGEDEHIVIMNEEGRQRDDIDGLPYMQSNASQTTIRKPEDEMSRRSSSSGVTFGKPSIHILEEQKEEEEHEEMDAPNSRRHSGISFDEHGYHLPVHSRTPARTKRRSVSSSVAAECRPSMIHSNSFSNAVVPIVNYLDQLQEVAPPFFSTSQEKDLLRSLEILGFDVGQMQHSVTSDACDASAATWWMLRSKQQQKEDLERYQLEGAVEGIVVPSGSPTTGKGPSERKVPAATNILDDVFTAVTQPSTPKKSELPTQLPEAKTQIELGPPVPTLFEGRRPSLSPESRAATSLGLPTNATQKVTGFSTEQERSESSKSVPMSSATAARRPSPPVLPTHTEPLKSADEQLSGAGSPGSQGKRADGGKARSSSISMLQRATSALSTGLVRKKSEEKLLEDAVQKDTDVKKSPTKLIKTPPMGRQKGSDDSGQFPVSDNEHSSATHEGIPPSTSYGTIASSEISLPDSSSNIKTAKGNKKESLLMTFRSWWNEDRKKRKRNMGAAPPPLHQYNLHHTPSLRSQHIHAVKRTTVVQRRSPADGRPHLSRRSSSVNSRRSSITSLHMPSMDLPVGSPIDPYTLMRRQNSRRSTGSRTPTSEFGEYMGSRPSSVRSVQMGGSSGRHLHGKAGSFGSLESRTPTKSSGPRQHYRAPSASSTRSRTRPGPHHRTVSSATTTSIRSAASSRRSSTLYDDYNGEDGAESGADDTSVHSWRRRSVEDRLAYPTVLIAKRTRSPLSTQFVGPASFAKLRPMPPIRDVFADKGKGTATDEDWISDEDEPGSYAGGLGQCSTSGSGNQIWGSTGGSRDSSAQRSVGSFSSMPAAYTRGSARNGGVSRGGDTRQKQPATLEPVTESRSAVRTRGAIATSRPADITEEEEPEE